MNENLEPKQRAVTLVLILIAAGVVLGLGASFFASLWARGAVEPPPGQTVVIEEEFDDLRVDVQGADVKVAFDDVENPLILFAPDRAGQRTLDASVAHDRLEVFVRGGAAGLPLPFDDEYTPVLEITLPFDAAGLDARLTADVGDIAADGRFGALVLRGTAGDLVVSGTALTARASSNLGNVDATGLAVEGSLAIDSGAGDVTVELLSLPSDLTVETGAGEQVLVVPEGDYVIDANSGAGDVVVAVAVAASSDRRFSLASVAGDITVAHEFPNIDDV